MTNDVAARLEQHRRGHAQTTRRLGGSLELVIARPFASRHEALMMERRLKSWKHPAKAIAHLTSLSG